MAQEGCHWLCALSVTAAGFHSPSQHTKEKHIHDDSRSQHQSCTVPASTRSLASAFDCGSRHHSRYSSLLSHGRPCETWKCSLAFAHMVLQSTHRRSHFLIITLAAMVIAIAQFANDVFSDLETVCHGISAFAIIGIYNTHLSFAIITSAMCDPTLHSPKRHCTSGNRTAISPDWVMYRTQGSEGYCN